MRTSSISRLFPLASPAAFSLLSSTQDTTAFRFDTQEWSGPRRFKTWLSAKTPTAVDTVATPSIPYFASRAKKKLPESSPDQLHKHDNVIPPPCHFDDPMELSVVVSWVEDIFSDKWGVLEDVKPLFYELGLGYTQVAICVSHTQKNIYVTFRGTDIMEFPDVMANLNILWDSFGPWLHQPNQYHETVNIPGKVQRGWNQKVFNPKLYLPLSDELMAVKQAYPDYRVIVAGHSLGAALSILYGVYVAKYVLPKEEPVQVINLGAPRVGDEEFYHAIQKIPNLTIWRMVFRDDIVPRCPPMILGYRHVGHMLHWDETNTVKAYHQQLESCMDSDCYAGIEPSDWNILFGSIGDHEHANYKCIVQQAEKNPDKYWPKAFEMVKTNE